MVLFIVGANPSVYLPNKRPIRKIPSLDEALYHRIKLNYFSRKARFGAYGW